MSVYGAVGRSQRCVANLQQQRPGSLSPARIAEELPAIVAELASGTMTTDALPLPLRDVETSVGFPGRR
jgi:hypothetical protein